MRLTPGIRFLFTTLPEFIAAPLCLHLASQHLLSAYYGFHLSRALIVSIWAFTTPLYCYIKATVVHWFHAHEARRLGAKLIPQVEGKLPGNIDLIWTNFGKGLYLGDAWAQAVDSHGTTFGNTILGVHTTVTANPQNMKYILATDFNHYEKGPKFNMISGSVLGVGVFNSDGDMWQFHRKLTRPFFAKERVTDFGIFDSKSSIALQKMEERFIQGHAIDFQDICGRFTIDSACEFLLGTSIHSLDDPLPRPGEDFSKISTPSNRFSRAFANAQSSISARARIGFAWPLAEIFKDRTTDDMKEVRGFIEPIVREAMSKRTGGGASEKDHDSLLQHLLDVTQDMKLIVDETINILLAGRDTTAGLLTFITYCLALHPHVLARLREEIISTVGTNRGPTFDDVRGMKYLRAVLNETLRLFPSVPFNSRHTFSAAVLVDEEGNKLYVPPKTRVVFSSLLSQRHKPYWGQDAHLFDPNRFLDERVKHLTSNPFIFIPFSAGPRICLGQQFAYHEVSYFVIRMLQRYDRIELAPECQPESSRPPSTWKDSCTGTPRKAFEQCVIKSHLTLYADGGLWLRMGRCKVTEGV